MWRQGATQEAGGHGGQAGAELALSRARAVEAPAHQCLHAPACPLVATVGHTTLLPKGPARGRSGCVGTLHILSSKLRISCICERIPPTPLPFSGPQPITAVIPLPPAFPPSSRLTGVGC